MYIIYNILIFSYLHFIYFLKVTKQKQNINKHGIMEQRTNTAGEHSSTVSGNSSLLQHGSIAARHHGTAAYYNMGA